MLDSEWIWQVRLIVTQDRHIVTLYNYLNLRIAEKLLFSDVASLHSPYKYLKALERRLDCCFQDLSMLKLTV